MKGAAAAPLKVLYEVAAILGEVVRIPLRAWIRIAEVAGSIVLAAWRKAWPLLAALAAAAGRFASLAARVATPFRAAVAVSLVAVATLAASQFVDYRAVEIGAPQYRAVAGVAPPPEVDRATPRSAHGAWVLVLDAAALAVIAVSVTSGRKRYARLLVPLGAAVVAIALAADAPKGLETGQAGVSYQGAEATLLAGFGAEVASASVLALGGLLIAAYGSGETAPAGRGARPRRYVRPGEPSSEPIGAPDPREAG